MTILVCLNCKQTGDVLRVENGLSNLDLLTDNAFASSQYQNYNNSVKNKFYITRMPLGGEFQSLIVLERKL